MTKLAEGPETDRNPLKSLTRRLLAHAGELRADTSGVAAVVAAIVFPVVVGGMGLGAETGLVCDPAQIAARRRPFRRCRRCPPARRRQQGSSRRRGYQYRHKQWSGDFRRHDRRQYAPGERSRCWPPKSVEVILTEVRPRFFSSVFSSTPVTITTRAVAKYTARSQACVLALSPVASGAVTVTGATNVALPGLRCRLQFSASNSFLMSGSGTMSTGCVDAVGHAVTTPQLTLTQCARSK
jgi:hypothetical protein